MTTSQQTPMLLEVSEGSKIPEAKIAYFEQRALNHIYAVVLERFLAEKAAHNLTKAELAQRINRGQDQVNRWLASPGNWTIATVARLLLGIAGEEPVLSTKSLLDRGASNHDMSDLLIEATDERPIVIPPPSAMTVNSARQYDIKWDYGGPHLG